MPVLDWLLEDDNPAVQYLTRTRLLGESPSSRRSKQLISRSNTYPPLARMLDRVDHAIAAGNYKKYQGAYWTLIFLADLHANGKDPRARRLAEHALSTQLHNGGFSASAGKTHDVWMKGDPEQFEIVCLTANVLRALVHLGYADDERVTNGYERLAERIVPHDGVPCRVLDWCMQTSCKMTLPQTLRAAAVAPSGLSKRKRTALRRTLVDEMLGIHVFRYVRPDIKQFKAAICTRPKGTRQRDFRDQWIARKPYSSDELVAKDRWKRFGFPRSYNPDILEAMLALSEAGVPYHPAMQEALEHIESKRGRDGRWKMEDSLNGKMQAAIERKGGASKWVTFRALYVLQHYGRAAP